MEPAVKGCLAPKLQALLLLLRARGRLKQEQSETCSRTLFETAKDFINVRAVHVASGAKLLAFRARLEWSVTL